MNPSKNVMRQPHPNGGDMASPQDLMNQSFDPVFRTFIVQMMGRDSTGENLYPYSSTFAILIAKSGTDTYVAEASPGTSQGTAAWRIQKVDSDGNITWKDGNDSFDNTATDITTGSFS